MSDEKLTSINPEKQIKNRNPFRDFKLSTRLTVLMVVIAIPLLILASGFIVYNAGNLIEEKTNEELYSSNVLASTNFSLWLDQQGRVITQLSAQPDIKSMDPAIQTPALKAVDLSYPNIFLVHTLNKDGSDIARSDQETPQEYGDRYWFQNAVAGIPLTYEVLISRTSGRAALTISAPITDETGKVVDERATIVGVVSSSNNLDDVSKVISAIAIGESGYVFVVDEKNNVVAHPDPTYTTSNELYNLGNYPPVQLLRSGLTGITTFTDGDGTIWRAYLSTMDNGWGVIAQAPEAELLAPIRYFQIVSIFIVIAGGLVLLVFIYFVLRRALYPITELTRVAQAVTSGDLDRQAVVRRNDEIGLLSLAINNMTRQLKGLISGLEKRVEERTSELNLLNDQNTQRLEQLEAISSISTTIATEQDIEKLLPLVTRLISDQFDFYHVGIFLLNKAKTHAVLQAANSAGGRNMLARRHTLEVGLNSIVGYVALTHNPRIVLNVGKDDNFFNNPDLPNTQSEMALPLIVHDELIGVLDIQSNQTNAFTEEDARSIGILASQVAASIDNANLFNQFQQNLKALGELSEQNYAKEWFEFFKYHGNIGYRQSRTGAQEFFESEQNIDLSPGDKENSRLLKLPVKLRGVTIGTLQATLPEGRSEWRQEEISLAQAAADRAALAIENARLLQEAQKRASKERVIGDISAKISSSVSIDTIIQTAAEELGQIISGSEIVIQFKSDDSTN